jgi:large-conductance mechanosensitive channel
LESGAAYLSLVSSNNTIANIPDINTNGILTDYSFVIKGDWVGESVTLTIGLGTSERGKGASGHLFVDNALSVTSDEAAFDAVLGNAHSARYDFNLISFAGTGTGAVKAPSQWTPVTGSLTSVDINNVTAGIIDLDNFNAGSLGHLTKAQIGADNVTGPSLVIFSAVETAFGYRYAFPVTYATGKYYKLTLRVKTIGIPVGKGATISVDSENVFTNINTEYFLEDLNENTLVEYRTVGTESVLFNVGYVEYSFIINNTGDTSPVADGHNIQVMLGNSDKKANRTTGCVIIDDIAVAEIDATAFNEYANKLEVEEDETAPTNIINIGAAVAETGDTVEETPKTPIDWWVIPSAAFAFALILAVILIVIRKLLEMRTKHFKAATITYDRNTTLARMKKDARAVKASDDFEETPTESKRPDRTEPLTDDTAEPAAERKPRPKPAAPVAEPLVDAEVEPETVKPEPATPVIKPEVKPEIKPEVKAEEVKPEVKTEEVKAESVSEPEVKAEEGKPEVKPEIKAEEVKPEPVAEPEVKTEEVKAELVSEPEVKTEEVKAESVSEPEVKAEEVKAEVTAETETTEPVAEAEQTEPVAEAESTESTESVTEADDKKSEE